MSVLGLLLRQHTAAVETLTSAAPTGDVFAAPLPVPGFLDDAQALVAAPGGTQLVAQTKFYAELGYAPAFTPGSRVTCNGRVMHVTEQHLRAGTGPLLPVAHVEIDLQ